VSQCDAVMPVASSASLFEPPGVACGDVENDHNRQGDEERDHQGDEQHERQHDERPQCHHFGPTIQPTAMATSNIATPITPPVALASGRSLCLRSLVTRPLSRCALSWSPGEAPNLDCPQSPRQIEARGPTPSRLGACRIVSRVALPSQSTGSAPCGLVGGSAGELTFHP